MKLYHILAILFYSVVMPAFAIYSILTDRVWMGIFMLAIGAFFAGHFVTKWMLSERAR